MGNSSEKRPITTSQAMKLLEKGGLVVSEKDAEIILEFLHFLAKLTVNQYVKDNIENR